MSYDLYVVRRDIPENFWDYGYDPDYDYGCYFNYTYNLGPFFAAYHVRPSTDLDGKTGIEPEARNRQGSIKPNALPPLPIQEGGMVFAGHPIDIDDPYLREFIEKARRT